MGTRIGRPRSTALDASIAEATLELLQEHGYAGLSFTAVAQRAGTTTPALYRRYASKADLVVEVVFRVDGDDVVADTGDIDADVRTMVRWAVEKFTAPGGRAALAGLLAEPVDPGQRRAPLLNVWRRIGARIEQGVERGELPPTADPHAAVLALAGPAVLAAAVLGPAAASDEWVERLSTLALDGIRGGR